MTETSEQTAEGLVESPSITGPDLLELAHQADNEEVGTEPSAQQESVQTESSGDRAPEASGEAEVSKDKAEPSAEQEQAQRERDEKGRFLPKQQAQEQEAQPESKYAKAKKEEERQKGVLAGFEQRKQAWEAQAAAREAEIARKAQEIEKFKAVPRSQDGRPFDFNAKQYADAADDFYGRGMKALQDGDPDAARENFTKAQEAATASQQVWQAEQQLQQEHVKKQHDTYWAQNMEAAIQQNPERAYNPDNPLSQKINKLLENEPLLYQIPNGFGVASFIAELQLKAEQSSALSTENSKLKAEVEDLRRRTGIRPSPSSGIPPAKTPDNMSDGEMRSFLMEQIRNADAF